MNVARFLRHKVSVLEIWLSLAGAYFLVQFVPFKWWRKTIGPIGETPAAVEPLDQATLKRAYGLGQAVERIADSAWFAPVCFPRALAAFWVLKRRGIPSRVAFGSRREANTINPKLLFHAWLLVGEMVVTGRCEHHTFAAFEKRTSPTMNAVERSSNSGDAAVTPTHNRGQ